MKGGPLAPLTILLLQAPLQAASPQPRAWLPETRALSNAAVDGDSHTYELLCTGVQRDPCDIGLEWPVARSVGRLVADYATLAGRAYQPDAAGQHLEYRTGSGWRPLAAAIEVDYRNQRQFAWMQGSGTVRWTYRFAPVSTTAVRLVLSQPQNEDPGHRCYAVRELQVVEGDRNPSAPGFQEIGALPGMPGWLRDGANLVAAGRILPGPPVELRFPRRLLVNYVKAEPASGVLGVEWWDGASWRDVETLPSGPGEARFAPIAVERLRLKQPARLVEARLDTTAARYFREVEHSRVDLLGERFRRMHRPDLAGMQSLLLPLDFAKAAIGRPADEEETVVMWNGTFLMAESGGKGLDRWFAPAAGAGHELFGTDWMRTASRLLDGSLPATVTTYQHRGFEFAQTLYVTAPDHPLYGTVAEVTVTNRSSAAGDTVFTLALGQRRNQRGPGAKSSPFYFDPVPTGYLLDPDRRTVRSKGGEIILRAEAEGEWGGTPRENHLRYALRLGPGQSRTLRFFVPSVERNVQLLETIDWPAALAGFRSWWNRKIGSGMHLELPDPQLNQIYRNLLAQSLIITLDGDSKVRYGAYFYESYFGIEEGWPAVALAQYGHPAEAQQILSAMLAPDLMEKTNAHHQYRNGLEPWYAITVYRLTRDRAWLEKLAPALQEAADWTIRVTEENRDPRFAGVLPKHIYSGDIRTPAYSLYSNATCWRGLNDTALAFRILGRSEQAGRYQQAADRYRKRLAEVADRLADRSGKPVFLPMSFEVGSGNDYREKEPSYPFLGIDTPAGNTWTYLGNYWNLFAPMLLEVKLFERDDRRARWVPDYMEARGGILAGLVRFTLGLDQIYGKGYYESLLEQGRRDEFWTSLTAIFAHGMSQNLFSFPEVAGVFPLRVSNSAMWREYQRNLWNWYFLWNWGFEGWQTCEGEPLSAGPGMALQILRMALVRETLESSPQDTLRLLDGVPSHWFDPGRRIVIRDAPTFFGKVSVETEGLPGGVRATVTRSSNFGAREVTVRLGRPFREVSLNGRPWTEFSGAEVVLPQDQRVEIRASFQ